MSGSAPVRVYPCRSCWPEGPRKGRHWMSALRRPWLSGLLALGVWQGCGEAGSPPSIGANLMQNSSFEDGLQGWWTATDSEGGMVTATPEAAHSGALGLALYKGKGGWGSSAGQDTAPHSAGQTLHVSASLKGAAGGERAYIGYHSQGFWVTLTPEWQRVSRLMLMPDASGDAAAFITNTTELSTIYVDDVIFAPATVAQGNADKRPDNLLRNGSFESELSLWDFWTDSPGGTASTSPAAGRSGYAGLVLTKGADGWAANVKQQLVRPLAAGERYRVELQLQGTRGGERVEVCLQVNYDPWHGPCLAVVASKDWRGFSGALSVDAVLHDEYVGALVSLRSQGAVRVDDVTLVRSEP
jgi:hypothetical protein